MNIEEAVSLKYTVIGAGRYKRTKEHDSLVIDTWRNTFFWNSKGFGGGVEKFLVGVAGVPEDTAKMLSTPTVDFLTPSKPGINKELYKLFYEFGKNQREFWYSRGFTDVEIDLYQLGYFAGNYTIPFIFKGELNAVGIRGEDRYISWMQGSKSSIFGFDVVQSKNLIIVESPLDVPLLRRYGYDAISYTFGANSWEVEWNDYLSDFSVTIISDNDDAGLAILKKLTVYCKVAQWPKKTPKGFDIGKLYKSNPDKFKSNVDYLLERAVPINFIYGNKTMCNMWCSYN